MTEERAERRRRKGMLRGLVLTAAVGFGAGLLGVVAGSALSSGPPAPPAGLHEFVHDDLDLTTEQHAALDEIEAQFATERTALEQRLREANRELAAAIHEQPEYSAEVGEAISAFHSAMGELQTATVLHVYDMRAILTESQAQLFDERIAEAMAAAAE